MNVRFAIAQAIERIPNLLGATVMERFTGKRERVTHSQEHVADLIAAVLAGSLKADGYLIVKLPAIDVDEAGRRTIRVPVTAQPWSDGEVRIARAVTRWPSSTSLPGCRPRARQHWPLPYSPHTRSVG
ncbi:hypothetical protein [Mycobacteroides abscessus]|uniref:hypothetical protein n=1 Tax=Mycobacteroides abscessus TaxID=36809 RepID=UPI003AF43E44